jgi:hypothetical protein
LGVHGLPWVAPRLHLTPLPIGNRVNYLSH